MLKTIFNVRNHLPSKMHRSLKCSQSALEEDNYETFLSKKGEAVEHRIDAQTVQSNKCCQLTKELC